MRLLTWIMFNIAYANWSSDTSLIATEDGMIFTAWIALWACVLDVVHAVKRRA